MGSICTISKAFIILSKGSRYVNYMNKLRLGKYYKYCLLMVTFIEIGILEYYVALKNEAVILSILKFRNLTKKYCYMSFKNAE